jgi:hypothetical protein
MSRNSQIVENPAVKTLKWKNEKTKKNPKTKEVEVLQETGWYYYDKSLNGGEGAEVKVDLPITFVWLETASSIMGYNKEEEASVWSNEVLNTGKEPLSVRVGKKIEIEGLYKNIKDAVKGLGGKFCSAVYALVDVDGEKEVWRFLMKGSANSAWISFSNRAKNKNSKIVCFETKVVESPVGSYEEPVFKYIKMTQEESDEADKVAAESVEPYFEYISNMPKVESPQTNDEYTDEPNNGDY